MTRQTPSTDQPHPAHGRVHGEHPWGDRGQLLCLLIFLAVWILDSFVFRFSTSLAAVVPLFVRVFAAGLVFVFAIYLLRSGHRAISHEVQNQPRILCDGAFARVRHPLYLAALLFYKLLFLLTLSLLCLGLIACISLFYNFIASYEERWLAKKFGQAYQDYKTKVPRWIPRIVPARF